MTEASDRKIALVALGIVFGGFFSLPVLASGPIGILIVGGIIAAGLIAVSFLNFDRPVAAWIAGMAGVAVLVALAGTLASETLWRTELPRTHGEIGPDAAPGFISENGVVLTYLIISLAFWFTASFVAEGVVIAAWRAVRRVRVHGTLFPAA